MQTMTFKQKGRYRGYTVDTQEQIISKLEKLQPSEIVTLWYEYEHQFKNPPTLAHKVIAWIHLQAFTTEVMDRLMWNFQTRKPKHLPIAQPGQGNPAKRTNPDAYMREDYYTNPDYGWCGE
jgi:hypothetical protein